MKAAQKSGENARPGRGGTRPRVPQLRAMLTRTLETFPSARVFREARKTAPGVGAFPL